MSKPIVMYHAPCYDGFGAAYAAWLKFKDEADYVACTYGKPLPTFEPDRPIYMIDFSGTRDEMLYLNELSGNQLVILDHHKTAEENLKGLPFATFDMDRSGALMAADYFHSTMKVDNPELYKFFQHLSDRDLWQFRMSGTNELHAVLACYPYKFEVWNQLVQNGLEELYSLGAELLKYRNQLVDQICKTAYWSELDGHKVIKCNATCLWSEIGNELCKRHPEAKFAAVYYFDEYGKKWSLRSIGDFDVSEIAKQHGGGGHKNAAGFAEKIVI